MHDTPAAEGKKPQLVLLQFYSPPVLKVEKTSVMGQTLTGDLIS